MFSKYVKELKFTSWKPKRCTISGALGHSNKPTTYILLYYNFEHSGEFFRYLRECSKQRAGLVLSQLWETGLERESGASFLEYGTRTRVLATF